MRMTRGPLLLAISVANCGGVAESAALKPDAAIVRDATTPKHDSVVADAATPKTDAGIVVEAGPLPACHWPSNLNAQVPDGDVLGWYVGRALLACGPADVDGGPLGALGLSDSGTSLGMNATINGDTYCLMGCEPSQYALSLPNWFGLPPRDADVVRPVLPPGCGGTRPAFTTIWEHVGSAEPVPTFYCCPCE